MSEPGDADPPMAQRLYDRIWLLALAALLFWALAYVVWGIIDIISIQGGPA